MPQQPERYFVGPNLRDKLREVITRVDGMPAASGGGGKIPVVHQSLAPPGGLRLHRGTFSGSWGVGETKTIAVLGNSAATVSVTNYCVGITQSPEETAALNVIFGNVMGTNSVVEIQPAGPSTSTCSTKIAGFDLAGIPGYSPGTIQLLGHTSNVNPSDTNTTICVTLQWFSITQCSTATGS